MFSIKIVGDSALWHGKTAVSSTKLNVLENVELELQSLQVFSFWTRTRQNQKLNQRL